MHNDDVCPNSCPCSRRKGSIMFRLGVLCKQIIRGDNVEASQREFNKILDEEWTPIIACRLVQGFEPEYAKLLEQARLAAKPGMKIRRLVDGPNGTVVNGELIYAGGEWLS
jgi:hypothetical protein